MGAWLEEYSVDCDGRSLVPAGGGEVNVLPEHTKIYICIPTIVYWLLEVSGGGCKKLCLCGTGDNAVLGRTGSADGS